MANILYSWQFSDKKNRWAIWYSLSVAIAIWIIAWWFLQKQYWISIVTIMLIWLFFYMENNSTDIIPVSITEEWVHVLDSFYSFSNIKSYSIIYDNDKAVLLRLQISKKIRTLFSDIPLDNANVNEVKNVLSNFIEEDKKWELWFVEKLIKILKL